jgi:RNA polymerase sigma factor (sigma-70 family)
MEELVTRAQQGDAVAVNELVAAIQPRLYGLAVRMLWDPEDAKDATQEILMRIVTRLATYRARSSFLTWSYRVAANHLLTWRKSKAEAQGFTFESFRKDLEDGLADHAQRPEDRLLIQEIRVGCTLGMLLCLDRPHRLAYILGEILEFDSKEAAFILGTKRETFRKRLERARNEIVTFMRQHCGLAHAENRCRCHRRLQRATELKRVDRDRLLFALDPSTPDDFPNVLVTIRQLEDAQRSVALYRSHPDYSAPDVADRIRKILGL